MKYMGSKARIAKDILPIILADKDKYSFYVEPFVGGCNLIDKVNGIARVASDNNFYLIYMWKELQNGWRPPQEITRDFYNECREKYYKNIKQDAHIIGYVGFNGSYGGRFYDGGFAGITKTKEGKERNYPFEAYKNIMKQVVEIKDILFIHCDYSDLLLPSKSIIYCDIPYKNTKQYKTAKEFDYEEFYTWCRNMKKQGHKIFISEYEMPDDFICVWSKEVKSSLSANGQIGGNKNSVEKLFTIKEK